MKSSWSITVVSLVVIIGIIGILAGMCSCSQATREAARRGGTDLGEATLADASAEGGVIQTGGAYFSAAADKSEERAPDSSVLQRKIIYTAEVDLVVEDFGPIPSKVEEMVKRFDGYVAGSKIFGSPGNPRSGRWTLRVPVGYYQEFLDAAKKLGEVRSVSSDSQDVSEEYYDVQARIRNKKKTEQRLLKHLEDSTGKLKDILAVEREVDRVRESIEQMEGRMRVLDELTALTTVNLSVEELKDYVPEEAVTYATRVSRAWNASLVNLIVFAQAASIVAVALAPWGGVLAAVLILPGLYLWLHIRRKR